VSARIVHPLVKTSLLSISSSFLVSYLFTFSYYFLVRAATKLHGERRWKLNATYTTISFVRDSTNLNEQHLWFIHASIHWRLNQGDTGNMYTRF